MKLRRLELEGFRGAPQPLPIKFSEKTSFVFSENGRGKSTLADGLEFLTSGDLLDFHREGCGLDAAVNLDSSSGARIEADVVGPNAHLKRTLTPQAVGALETDQDDLDVAPIPILRQSTINAFMRQTAGEKRQALLELLDLDALNAFRRTLRTALGNAKERRIAAERSRGEEEATLKALLGGSDLIARAGELAANAKLEEKITSEAQLDGLKLKLPPGEPNREAPLTDLTRALESLQDDPAPIWNEAVADAGIRGAEALAALLEQGKRVLDGDWDADACPLCEIEQDHDQLATQVKARAEVLAESRRKVAELREHLRRASDSSERLAATIDAILKVAPDGGWPREDDLKAAAGSLRAYARELARAGADFESCPSFPELDLDFAALMPLLHVAAAPKESPELAALQALNELQGQRRRLANRTKGAIGAQGDERALARLLEIADEKIKDAVEDALAGIADLVERYFGVLMANPIYSDVKLVYAARRSGQVEFQISYGPHAVNPPQRVMSESQLNALGLALLLARVKQSETPWRSLVLDDVVNSFDAAHRSGLVRLLRQEFAEWQLLILSHDPLFRDIAQREAAGEWEFREVVAWTPAGGPVLGEGDPLNRLDQGLKAGESAAALGGHARRALEQNLSRALGRLGYKIPFDPAGRYTSHDYLQALRSGFVEKGSVLAGSDVLRRIASGDYMATRIVHSRSDVPEAGSAELTHLVADLRDFDAMLCCDGCGKRVWYAKTNKGHQCECGKLKA